MGNCHTVGPNEALVISGGCCGSQGMRISCSLEFFTFREKKSENRLKGKKYLVGGCGWAWCLVTEVQRLSLEIMTLLPSVTNCESAKGKLDLTISGLDLVVKFPFSITSLKFNCYTMMILLSSKFPFQFVKLCVFSPLGVNEILV